MYAEIVLTRPTHRHPPAGSVPERVPGWQWATYTYRLPEKLALIQVGHLVQVPVRQATMPGVVVGLAGTPPTGLAVEAIRDIVDLLDPLPVVTPAQIALARWIAGEYVAPLSQSLRLMLPPGLEARTFLLVSAAGDVPAERERDLPAEEAAALRLLRRHGGRVSLETLSGQIPAADPEAVVQALADRGLVDVRYTLVPPRPAPPRVQYVRLLADDETVAAALPRLGKPSRPADALLVLAHAAGGLLPLDELCTLAGCTELAVQELVRRGWVHVVKKHTLVIPLPHARQAELTRAPRQATALAALLRHPGPVERSELLAEIGGASAVLSELEHKGLIRQVTEPAQAMLTLPAELVNSRLVELHGAQKQQAVLRVLQDRPGRVWVGGLYAETGADLDVLRDLAAHGLVSLHAEEFDRPRPIDPEAPPELTPDQEAAWRQVESGLDRPALLHGVTGSGKTEIYLRALEATLTAGRRGVVLVPEISLTPQTVRRFEARFPGRVAVLHSQLSLGQRYEIWDRVRRGEADVLVGPRSALMAPISRLGLIVVDEAHDSSYKQDDAAFLPSYHSVDVAAALGRITGARVILGSATPDVAGYYRARQGMLRLLEMPQRVLGYAPPSMPTASAPLPAVRLVDLRQELRAGNRSIFSRALQDALRQTLEAGEQAVLFMNRRGMATFVLCRDCGYVARCPRCEVPLTYHRLAAAAGPAHGGGERPSLVCHHCNHRERTPECCPQCQGRNIRYFGLGTERVEATVGQLFPDARLVRWDRDTATGLDHERLLQTFIDGRADVLIGTQMIAKGLDLPLVTLVGVVSADTGLYLPDFRAAERTFQVLTQVAGRAGRSARGGQVIVQTYSPDHYAIQAAAGHDYAGFYRQELAYRRQLGYPPFSRLVALRYTDKDGRRCREEAERLGRWLAAEVRRLSLPFSLIGPAPCFFGRIEGRYRWQLVIRAPDPVPWLRDLLLPRGWRIDVDPISLL